MYYANKAILYSCVLASIALATGCNPLYKHKIPNRLELTVPPSITPNEITSIDIIDDGKYLNEYYDFKLDYPEKKLVQTDSFREGATWIYEKNRCSGLCHGSKPTPDYAEYVLNIRDTFRSNYEVIYDQDVGESYKFKGVVASKIYSHDYGDYKYLQIRIEDDPNYETQRETVMTAIWLREENPVISLDLRIHSNSDYFIHENMDIFDEIVKHFAIVSR